MIWLTWRQFRAQAATIYVALAVLAVVFVFTGPELAHLAQTSGNTLLHRLNALQNGLYGIGELAVLVVPPVIGAFWGAPLITRELDAGTHRLIWNQSITRTRWLATKLGLTGLASMAAAGLISLAVSLWCQPIDAAADATSDLAGFYFPRMFPLVFDTRGIAPIGYTAFAFTLGVTLGVLLRRTLPAMATTLVTYLIAQSAWTTWIRPHLLPSERVTTPITAQNFRNLSNGITVQINAPGAWITAQQTTDPSGRAVAAPASAIQGCLGTRPGQSDPACFDRVTAGFRQLVTYQPANHFWALQWYEAGIYLALAAALGLFCAWWIRHRVS